MKKLFTLLLLTLLPFSAMAEGDDPVIIDGICYNLIGKGLAAEVVAFPKIAEQNYSGDVTIPSSVTYEGSVYSVDKIASRAFYGCNLVTSVSIPPSVKIIGTSAFSGCTSLATIEIPDGVNTIEGSAFADCTSLNNIVIPSSITELVATFVRCSSLTDITIPSSVVRLYNTFHNCTSLKNITIPTSVTSINGAFQCCTSLETVEIPSSVEEMNETFSGCTNLNDVVVPSGIRLLSGTFTECSSLTNVSLPNSLVGLQKDAFSGCSSLTTITLPNSLKEIYADFRNCKNLKDIYCHALEPPHVDDQSFTESYKEYISVHVPESSIDAYKDHEVWSKFKGIVGFTSEPAQVVEIVTPEGEVIKTEVTITIVDEDSKTAIITAASIPASETGSTEIAIPANVGGYSITGIEANAFAGQTGITDIYLPDTDQPLFLGTNALKIDDEHVAEIHVPVGLLGSYALNEQLSQNFADGKVKATVTAPSRYWTFSAGVDVVVPEGVGVYICKFENEDQVRITELGDDQLLVGSKRIIKANNGVLIACIDGTGGNAYDIVANPGGQWSMAPASYDAKSYGYDNMLEPVLVSKNYPATDYYVLKNGEFHKILANSSKMPAGKAVLRIPGTGVAGARILSIVGGSNMGTAGIQNCHIIETESKWFDLQGRRIERPTKAGLYINNGKKVLVK